MRRVGALAFGLAAMAVFVMAADEPKLPAQAARGREMFLKSSKGVACGTCHAMGGIGTAIGPDLTQMATYAPPRGFASTMRMQMTEYVRQVKTTDAGTFPGMVKSKEGEEPEIWDLSQIPPVLRKLSAKQVVLMERDQKWRHPPSLVDYTSQELADLIGFLRWAATGSTKEIKPQDVE